MKRMYRSPAAEALANDALILMPLSLSSPWLEFFQCKIIFIEEPVRVMSEVGIGDSLQLPPIQPALHSCCVYAYDKVWPWRSVSFSSSVKWAKAIEDCTVEWIVINRILGTVPGMQYWERAGGHYSYCCCYHSFTLCKFQSLRLLILICMIQVAKCFVPWLSHLDYHITVDAQYVLWQWILLNFLSLPHQLSS